MILVQFLKGTTYLSLLLNVFLSRFAIRTFVERNWHSKGSLRLSTIECHGAAMRGEGGDLQEERPTRKMPEMIEFQRITDLVIPFHAAHVGRVNNNLQTWKQFPPCHIPEPNTIRPYAGMSRTEEEFYTTHGNLGRNVSLTFALSGVEDDGIRESLLAMVADLPRTVQYCFRSVKVYFAGLKGKEDGYYLGSRLLFENFLNNTLGLDTPYYAFYMEPDVMPVRKYWLSALDAMTRPPTAPFWVRGSLYRGGNSKVMRSRLYMSLHINGNAIYNLADRAFRDFYFKDVLSVFASGGAYDLEIAKALIDPDKFNNTRMIAHKFQYTDVIHNMWHWGYNKTEKLESSPNLYLIHGGIPR